MPVGSVAGMPSTPEINIVANKRVPFDDTIAEMWVDYTGATPLMEIRTEPGDSGTPLVSLGASASGGEGIEITYDDDYPDPDGEDPGATIVRILIDEATIEGLSYGADTADRVTLYYDIHLTPVGEKKFVFARGAFTIDPGVTR